jgi:hypothetical protein
MALRKNTSTDDTCKLAKKTDQLQGRISLSLFGNEEYSIAHGISNTFLHASLETLLWFVCHFTLESPKFGFRHILAPENESDFSQNLIFVIFSL